MLLNTIIHAHTSHSYPNQRPSESSHRRCGVEETIGGNYITKGGSLILSQSAALLTIFLPAQCFPHLDFPRKIKSVIRRFVGLSSHRAPALRSQSNRAATLFSGREEMRYSKAFVPREDDEEIRPNNSRCALVPRYWEVFNRRGRNAMLLNINVYNKIQQ